MKPSARASGARDGALAGAGGPVDGDDHRGEPTDGCAARARAARARDRPARQPIPPTRRGCGGAAARAARRAGRCPSRYSSIARWSSARSVARHLVLDVAGEVLEHVLVAAGRGRARRARGRAARRSAPPARRGRARPRSPRAGRARARAPDRARARASSPPRGTRRARAGPSPGRGSSRTRACANTRATKCSRSRASRRRPSSSTGSSGRRSISAAANRPRPTAGGRAVLVVDLDPLHAARGRALLQHVAVELRGGDPLGRALGPGCASARSGPRRLSVTTMRTSSPRRSRRSVGRGTPRPISTSGQSGTNSTWRPSSSVRNASRLCPPS